MKVTRILDQGVNSLALMILDNLWTTHKTSTDCYLAFSLLLTLPLISAVQILGLNLESLLLNLSSVSNSFESALQYLISTILIRKELKLQTIDSIALLILLFAGLYLALLLTYLGIVVICFRKSLPIPKRVSGNLINFGYFHLFFLALPIHNILLELLMTIIQDIEQPASKVALIIMVGILEGINIIFCLIPIKLEVLIKTKNPLSRTNNIYLLSTTIQKLVMTSLNGIWALDTSQTSLSILTLTLNFASNVISLCILCKTVPFYKFRLNRRIVTMEAWAVGIASISLLNLIFTGTSSKSKGYILFILSLIITTFTLKIGWSYMRTKRLSLSKKIYSSKISSTETFWIIHQIRYLKKLFSRALQPDLSLKKWAPEQLLEAGCVYDIYNSLELPYTINSSFPTKESSRDVIIQLLNRISEINPKNAIIKLLLAGYLIKRSEKIHEPAALIYQVLKSSQRDLSNQLSALLLQNKIKQILETNLEHRRSEIDLVSYFNSQKQYEKLKNLIEKQINLMEDFHKLISEAYSQALEVLKVSTKIQKIQTKVQKFWDSLPNEFLEKKSSFFLTYSIYNSFINYDQQKGNEYLLKYKKLITRNIANYKDNSIDDKTLYDSNNLTFYISGEFGTLGTIVDCSENVRNTLGFRKEELVGKNINVLMPSYFHQSQKQLLLNKLQNHQQLFEISHTHSFVKNSQGYIVPMKNLIVLYPSLDQGFLFCSIMRTFNTKFDYMLVSENGAIEGLSHGVGKELGLSLQTKPDLAMISPSLATAERAIQKIVNEDGNHIKNRPSNRNSEYDHDSKPHDLLDHSNLFENNHAKSDCYSYRQELESATIATKVMEKGHRFSFNKYKGIKGILEKDEKNEYYCKVLIKNYSGRSLKIILLQKLRSGIGESGFIASFSEVDEIFGEMHKITIEEENANEMHSNPQDDEDEISEFKECFPIDNERNPDSPLKKDKVLMFKSLEIHKFSTGAEIISPKEPQTEVKPLVKPFTKRKAKISISDLEHHEDIENPVFDKSSSRTSDYKLKEQRLSLLLEVLSFYKCREAKIPFLFVGLFIIVLLVATWLVYNGAVESIPNILGAANFFDLLLHRTNTFYLIIRETCVIYLFQLINSGSSYSASTLLDLLWEANDFNTKLKSHMKYLEAETESLFYEENVKVFYDIIPDINTTTSYRLRSSISAVHSIIEEGLYVANHAATSNLTERRFSFAMDFLLNNMYNDVLIENREVISQIYNDIDGKVERIKSTEIFHSTITGVFFGLSTFILGLILFKIYSRNIFFLNCLVDGGQDEEIHKMKSTIVHVRSFLNSDINVTYDLDQQKTNSNVNKAEKGKNTQHIINKKHLKSRGLLMLFTKRFLFITLPSLAALIILVKSNEIFKSQTKSILPAINDIIQAQEMSFQSQLALSEMLLYTVKPSSPVKYQSSSYMLESDIEALSEVLSGETTKLTPEFQERLTEDLCPYTNQAEFPDCETVAKSIATQGIIGSLYYTKEALTSLKKQLDSIPPGPMKLVSQLSNTASKELFSLIYKGVVPALMIHCDERSEHLSAVLSEGADIIVKYSICGAIISILILLGSWLVICPKIEKERKRLCRTLLLIPPYVLIKNKLLKEFLLRESKLFYNYMKNYQENRSEYLPVGMALKTRKFIKTNA